MIVNPFTIDVIKDYRMFFMLQNLNASSGNIDIYYQEINSDILFEGCSLFEMNNEYILVAFPDEYREQAKHNLIATNGTVSEVINLQSFERIYNYYKLGVDSEDHGGFTFMNSAAVPSFANQWRCDAGMYGVEFFADPTGDTVIDIPDEADELLVYEPIFSINGTAHLIYTERKNKTNKFNLMNNSVTQFAAYSLGESLKLISEWAHVSQTPFENAEAISIKSSEFISKLGFTDDLVSNQPDMQIFEYLKGNTEARTRPTNAQSLYSECVNFVKKNVSHMTLSHLVSLYPDCWDLSEIISEESSEFSDQVFKSFRSFVEPDISITLDNKNAVIESARQKTGNEGICQFMNLKFGFLQIKKNFLDLFNNDSSTVL